MIDNALGAAGTNAAAVGIDKLAQVGVLYNGLSLMGGGAILGGVVLGAIAACIIDRQLRRAAGFAFAGAALTFFGFMHGEAIGFAQTPAVAASYLLVAALLAACAKYAAVTAVEPQRTEHYPDTLPEPGR
jgi:AGZA family xanthine/uracil permease-like MFS transporter